MVIAQAKSVTQSISEKARLRMSVRDCEKFAKAGKLRVARKPVAPSALEISPAFVGIAG